MIPNDRTVHGLTINGDEIVRYDRAGKWYIEHTDGRRRHPVSVSTAAGMARAGTWYGKKPGGKLFDAIVRREA